MRFATQQTEGGDVEYLKRSKACESALFGRVSVEDAMLTRPIQFSADGRELYWLDSRDTAARCRAGPPEEGSR